MILDYVSLILPSFFEVDALFLKKKTVFKEKFKLFVCVAWDNLDLRRFIQDYLETVFRIVHKLA